MDDTLTLTDDVDLGFRYKHGWVKIKDALESGASADPVGHEGLGARVAKANREVRKPGDPNHIGDPSEWETAASRAKAARLVREAKARKDSDDAERSMSPGDKAERAYNALAHKHGKDSKQAKKALAKWHAALDLSAPLTLADIDLGRHVRDANYWHKPVGTPLGKGRTPKGGHLIPSVDERFTPTEKSMAEMADKVKELVDKASQAEPNSTEAEHAWGEVISRTQVLNDHAKAEADRMLHKRAPAKPLVEGSRFTADTAKEAVTTLIGQRLLGVGVHLAAAASGVLTAGEVEHFHEAFEKIAENRMLEAAAIVTVTILVNGLLNRLRKGLTKHRDKKIAKARAALGQAKLLAE